ncbi:MAG: YraN family protein [Chloroflexi bacterium]|nr:YraN family protein [Chloroflexota bacterium]MBU1749067.1 YraN family protein [Chloroflexota bacterium]MBU1877848.1 YraN family protein [Chloroflexota bacterium]
MTALSRQALGRQGEAHAADWLAQNGYRIHDRNWRPRGRATRDVRGELDIIAREEREETWVFVEVRARRGSAYGTPEESITPAKARQLVALAWAYLQEHELERANWRIDVVALTMSADGRVLHLNHIKHAIMGPNQ